MTEQEINLINKLEENIRRLVEMLEEKKIELKKVSIDLQDLETKYSVLEDEYLALNDRYENLKVAKAFIDGESGDTEAKQKINKIVREIDTCIALLNS